MKKIFLKYASIILFLTLAISAKLSAQSREYILILSKASQKLLVLDYNNLDTVASVSISEDPHEIVTNEKGSQVYISHPLMNANGHKISIVDLKTFQLIKTIDTRPFTIPHGLQFYKNHLWFTAQGSKIVGVYDTEKDSVTMVLGTGQNFTHLLHVTEDEKTFYATNVESGTLTIYEKKEIPSYMPPTGVLPAKAKPRTEWIQTLINVGTGAEGFDVSADGKELWTARPDGHIIIVDLQKKKIKKDINTKVEGLHRLKFTPDGKTVCIVSVKTGDLLYYNSKNYQPELKQKIGKGAGIYMDDKSNRMLISCTPDNEVVVIDLLTRKVINRLKIGRPDGIIAVEVIQ